MRGMLKDGAEVREFVLAGKAIFTVVSKESGRRFTYKVVRSGTEGRWWVSVLSGPDNEGSYQYIGMIQRDREEMRFIHTKGSKVGEEALSFVAFGWLWGLVRDGEMSEKVEVWHEGKCGRCGRRLTVPESIESGIGPECAKRRMKV